MVGLEQRDHEKKTADFSCWIIQNYVGVRRISFLIIMEFNVDNSDLPNFMIIGAAKAGTTSLHYYLQQHPQIFLPKEKEIQFFTDDQLYNRGKTFYIRNYFKDAHRFPARGEATPFYLHRPEVVIPRLKKTFPDGALKFLVLLRNPAKRAWSHYLHMVRLGLEIYEFDTALAMEEQRMKESPLSWFSYYTDGLYSRQLKRWFSAYPKENFFIVTQDEFASETHKILQKIFSFLNVDETHNIRDLSLKNEAGEAKSRLLMQILMGQFSGSSLLKGILPVPFRRRIGMILRHMNTQPAKNTFILPARIINDLEKRYDIDLEELEKLLGRSFEGWRIK